MLGHIRGHLDARLPWEGTEAKSLEVACREFTQVYAKRQKDHNSGRANEQCSVEAHQPLRETEIRGSALNKQSALRAGTTCGPR